MKKHGNTGKKNALKSGRTAQLTVRVTPEVYEHLKSGETSAGDKLEHLVINAAADRKMLNEALDMLSDSERRYLLDKY